MTISKETNTCISEQQEIGFPISVFPAPKGRKVHSRISLIIQESPNLLHPFFKDTFPYTQITVQYDANYTVIVCFRDIFVVSLGNHLYRSTGVQRSFHSSGKNVSLECNKRSTGVQRYKYRLNDIKRAI